MAWYYFDNAGTRQGPFTDEQIEELIERRVIVPQTRLETAAGQQGLAEQVARFRQKFGSLAQLFYICDDTGTRQGSPVSREQLQTLANQGGISPQTRLEDAAGRQGSPEQLGISFPVFSAVDIYTQIENCNQKCTELETKIGDETEQISGLQKEIDRKKKELGSLGYKMPREAFSLAGGWIAAFLCYFAGCQVYWGGVLDSINRCFDCFPVLYILYILFVPGFFIWLGFMLFVLVGIVGLPAALLFGLCSLIPPTMKKSRLENSIAQSTAVRDGHINTKGRFDNELNTARRKREAKETELWDAVVRENTIERYCWFIDKLKNLHFGREEKDAAIERILAPGDGCVSQDDFEKALEWYKKAGNVADAYSKIPSTKIEWGKYFCERGEGCVSQNNFDEALEWYEKAVRCENTGAQRKIDDTKVRRGDYYCEQGDNCVSSQDGGGRNYLEVALEWYEKASEMGNAVAQRKVETVKIEVGKNQCGMGDIFVFQGNFDEALRWYEKAIRMGNTDAQRKIDELRRDQSKKRAEREIKQVEIKRDLDEFIRLHTRSQSDAGHWFVENSIPKMAVWKTFAENGCAEAQVFLAIASYVTGNLSGSASWYRRSAEQGNAWAAFQLGGFYLQGTGVPRDTAEAVRWFKRSRDNGFGLARDMLEHLASNGYR